MFNDNKKQFQISEAYYILDNLFINSKVNLNEDINISHSVYHIIKRHIFIKLNLKWLNLIMQIQSLNLKPTMAYNQNVVCIIFWSPTEAQWDQHCLNRVCPEFEVRFGFFGYFLGFCHQNTRLRHIIKTHYSSKYRTKHTCDWLLHVVFCYSEQKIHPVVTVSMLRKDILVLRGLLKGPPPNGSYVAHTMNWGFCLFFKNRIFLGRQSIYI